MKLKVVSKRTEKNNYFVTETSIVNVETGEPIEEVVHIQWELGVDGIPQAVITLLSVEADIEDDFEVVNV
jgi:hypothetical protein